MTEGVNTQETAAPEKPSDQQVASDKERNFRRLEAAREAEKEGRIRAEEQAKALYREMESIKSMLQPKEPDPLDSLDDYDPAKIKAHLAQKEAQFKREAESIARKTYEQMEAKRKEDEKANFNERLRKDYQDYDQVMSEDSLAELTKEDPEFLETALEIEDPYKRREKTYKRLKKLQSKKETPSIKSKVEENAQNPFYMAASHSPVSGAIDFDISTPAARQAAYDKLKAAQRKPIGR